MKQHKEHSLQGKPMETLQRIKSKEELPEDIRKSIEEKQKYINKPIRK